MATTAKNTKKPAASKAKTTTKKPVASKAKTTTKKPTASKAKTTKTPAKVTKARQVQAQSQIRKPVKEHTARKTVSSKNRVAPAVKKTTVLGVEVPTIDLRKIELPSTDEIRTEVVDRLEIAQDAVVGAPERVQELAGELHELYLDRFSDAIDKVRELVNR